MVLFFPGLLDFGVVDAFEYFTDRETSDFFLSKISSLPAKYHILDANNDMMVAAEE